MTISDTIFGISSMRCKKKIITSKDANDKKKKVYFDKEKLNVYFLPMIVTWMQEPKGSCD